MDQYSKQNPIDCQKNTINDQLQQNNKFLGTLAYQMRTALNAITGFSEILSMDQPRDDQKEHIFEINRASKALTTLVNDVIEFTKIDSRLAKQTRQCNLDELIEEVKSIVSFKAEMKNMDFEIKKSGDLPEFINANSRFLKDCITRLADSTVKLAKEDRIEIRILPGENETVQFEFFGGGINLDENIKKDLFEPFSVNLDKVYKDIEDTGLGFSIASKLADVIGAGLYIPDSPESIFVLNIPVGLEKPAKSKLVEDYIKSRTVNRDFQPKKLDRKANILTAEDNVSNQAVIRILLERLGCQVDMASNGKDAVQMASDKKYDLILMDVKMPEMDGYQAARIIRENGMEIPILALTAMDEAEVLDCRQGGCFDGYVSKPIDANKMKTALSGFLLIPQKAKTC